MENLNALFRKKRDPGLGVFHYFHRCCGPDAAPASAKKPATAAKAPAANAAQYDPALLQPATLRAKAPAEYEVKFVTTAGEFTIQGDARLGAERRGPFLQSGASSFLRWRRLFPRLAWIHGAVGISAYPEVAKVWDSATIKDDPIVQSNHRGFVSFATAGPNTRTTQFFINYGNNEASIKADFPRLAWSRTEWKWSTSCTTAMERALPTATVRIRGRSRALGAHTWKRVFQSWTLSGPRRSSPPPRRQLLLSRVLKEDNPG